MPEAGTITAIESILNEFGKGLHDLSQPVTTLQCRLFLGSLDEIPATMADTIRQSLDDCERVMERIHALQSRLQLLKSQNQALLTGDKP